MAQSSPESAFKHPELGGAATVFENAGPDLVALVLAWPALSPEVRAALQALAGVPQEPAP